jgi:hypothetical protein
VGRLQHRPGGLADQGQELLVRQAGRPQHVALGDRRVALRGDLRAGVADLPEHPRARPHAQQQRVNVHPEQHVAREALHRVP